MMDHRLYDNVCRLTQRLAKEMGIFWEEEQAEIVYKVVTNDYSEELNRVRNTTKEILARRRNEQG